MTRNRLRGTALSAAALLLALPAFGKELAGVTMPDTATAGDKA